MFYFIAHTVITVPIPIQPNRFTYLDDLFVNSTI